MLPIRFAPLDKGVRLLLKSPTNAYQKINKWIWRRLPPPLTALPPIRSYGRFLHRLVQSRARRRQYFGTFFFRNRPQLTLIRRLTDQKDIGSTLTIAFLGCSNGAEVYSTLWTIRSARPDLKVISNAVDISNDILELAQKGVYSLKQPELVGEQIFARIKDVEMQAMFDLDRDQVSVKSWIKEDITWHLGDASSPELADLIGPHDMVVANNFICHMDPLNADRCLRNLARLVAPCGYLFVSGVDLDMRTKVALDLGWIPVRDLIEAIHDGDPSVRNDWPWAYWGLEPLNKRRHDWETRYAAAFHLRSDMRRPA